jgi:flagellar motor switch protein FliN/FliY
VSQDRLKPANWFAEEWTAMLGGVLESLSGERPTVTCKAPVGDATLDSTSPEIARQHGAILWWKQAFPLPGDPVIWVGAPQTTWSQLGLRVLRAAGEDDPSKARETYLELLQQSLGELSRSAGRRWNREVVCSGGAEQFEPPPTAEFRLVETAYSDAAVPPLLLVIAGAPEEPPAEVAAPEPGQAPTRLSAGKHASLQSKTFDLLMEVELPVSVSFGHVQLPLMDILKLTAGSIVELNRMVDEPVEVIVNNCVVARGEVVVIEGNYGVRIHHIMSRQQRLESLP